jgi:predicted TIM-barrel fold metal-dependent hydrolase
VADFEVIDAHVHLWRTVEHERTALPLPGRRDRDRWGTPEAAIELLDRCGISKLVFLNVMPTVEMMEAGRQPDELAERIRRQNAWACEVGAAHDGRLVPFVGVQTLLGEEGAAEEVRVGHSRGAKGVKIQPGMNQYAPTDRAMWPVYEAAQDLGLPILSDSGTYGRPAPDGRPFGQPVNFVEVLESFPDLTLVMAHFASAYWDERVELATRHPNLQFDVSGGFAAPDLETRDGRRRTPRA